MRKLLDELDPFFAATAVAIAGMTMLFQMPEPPVILDHPPLEMPVTP